MLGPRSPRGSLDVEVCFLFLGELENAQSILQRCLELDPTSADAHLLMSQVYLAQGNFSMCSHCLELGVSHNFQVGVLCALSPTQYPKAQLATAPTCVGATCIPQTHLLARRQGQAQRAPVVLSIRGAVSSSGHGDLKPHTRTSLGPRPPPLPLHQGQSSQQVWGLSRSPTLGLL